MLNLDFTKSRAFILNKLSTQSEDWAIDIAFFLNEWWNDSSFIKAYTSGSTGKPKPIILKKDKVVNSALMTGDFFSFKEKDNALLCMSPKFIAGKLMIVRAIVWKMNLICVEPSSSPLENIQHLKIDFAAMVPIQLNNSISGLSRSKVKKLIVGGGTVDDKVLQELQKSDTEIYSSYGMTETITHIALKRLNGEDIQTEYKALKNVKFSIDKRNCLVIDAKLVSDEKVVTNDVVELKGTKEFVWIGRYDNVINSGGVKIHPEKVERILQKYIPSPFFISSLKDVKFGEKVVLFIEGETKEIDLDFFKEVLPKYNNPKDVFFIEKFVRTDSGKINRKHTLEKMSF